MSRQYWVVIETPLALVLRGADVFSAVVVGGRVG
jgi:hypothetical protein